MDQRSNGLVFDEENHKYYFNENPVISVTTVLKEAGLINSDFFTEQSRNRGIAVHHGVFLDINNQLDKSSLHPLIEGYMEAWFSFVRDTGFIAFKHLCERRMYQPNYQYAGTPDLVGMLNGRSILIDIKTGDSKTAKYQTAAYRQFNELFTLKPDRAHLRLFNSGKYSLVHHHDHLLDFEFFLDALNKVRLSQSN